MFRKLLDWITNAPTHLSLLPLGWGVTNDWWRTQGNDCYMEVSFQGEGPSSTIILFRYRHVRMSGTGVSIFVAAGWNYGPYSCQLDGGDLQWFNANYNQNVYRTGCKISGIANQQHTLRVTNAPISGFYLVVYNITVTQGDQYTGTKQFT